MATMEVSENSLWPKHVVRCYVDILVEEVTKGNMNNGVFSPKVWRSLLAKLNSKTSRSFNLKQIKQKFNRLRAKHREFSLLLQHNGFGWDAKTNTVTADEEVWENYILAHPEAAPYKKQGLEHYNLLGIIFNGSIAATVLHHVSTQDPPSSPDELELENGHLHGGVHVDLDRDDDVSLETMERVTRSGKRIVELPDQKKKKECRSNQLREAIQALAEARVEVHLAKAQACKTRAEVHLAKAERLRVRSTEASGVEATSFDYSVAKCVSGLNEIDNVSDDVYVKAVDKFTDVTWREIFMAMPLERKKAWLDRLI